MYGVSFALMFEIVESIILGREKKSKLSFHSAFR